jgi:hypothetical protein
MALAWRISGVKKGCEGREVQEEVRRGACLSMREVRVELKRSR